MMIDMVEFRDDLAMLIERGGAIMVPLIGLSIISLALIIERAWFWMALHKPGRLVHLRLINESLRQGDPKLASQLLRGDKSVYGFVAGRLIDAGATEGVAIEAVETQRPRLDRFMTTLSTIITAAPLLGILGTVIGIIQSFDLLGEQQTLTDPRAVSAGIAEALLTTAMGLVVALVTLFPYMIFKAQSERALGRLESLIAAAQQGAGDHSAADGRRKDSARVPEVVTTKTAVGATGAGSN